MGQLFAFPDESYEEILCPSDNTEKGNTQRWAIESPYYVFPFILHKWPI